MLSTALAALLEDTFADDREGMAAVQAIGGRALRETTRLGASPYSMWRDVAMTNTEGDCGDVACAGAAAGACAREFADSGAAGGVCQGEQVSGSKKLRSCADGGGFAVVPRSGRRTICCHDSRLEWHPTIGDAIARVIRAAGRS